MVFDPHSYKVTTRQQWDEYAQGWSDWAPFLETWLGAATERMLDLAQVTTGDQVLDVAAGAGGQGITAARRVGPAGAVLATDLSPTILEHASRAAEESGVANLSTLELDGERLHELPGGHFDAVISRLGLIYFPDRQRALAGIRHTLRDGGRLASITYAAAAANGFFSVPVSIIRQRAQLPAPSPDQPGPFSLSDPTTVAGELKAAGFRDVEVELVDAPVRLASAVECTRFERESFGALHQMLAALPPADQDVVWKEIEIALGQFDTPDGFVGPCRLIVARGIR